MQSVGGAPDKGSRGLRGPNRDKAPPAAPTASAGGGAARGGKKSRQAELPLQVNPKKVTFAVLDQHRRVAKAAQGRTYWTAMCNPPLHTNGKLRTAKFAFSPWQSAAGAVGMLPPNMREDDLNDWLGYQLESAAVWLDGACRRNGRKLNNVVAAPKAATDGDLILCQHQGTTLTITRDGELLKKFYNVPADWCFAAGAFGGKVTMMREHEEDDSGRHHLARLVFSDITAFKVPDGDMGPSRSDVFVEFELLNEDGTAAQPFADGRPRVVQTAVTGETMETIEFPDQIGLPLPSDYVTFGGLLSITLYDDDLKSADDALGKTTMPIIFSSEHWQEDKMILDHLVLKGEMQKGAAGYRFPDAEISFTIRWKGAFHP